MKVVWDQCDPDSGGWITYAQLPVSLPHCACLSAIHKPHHTHHHSICSLLLQGSIGHRKWEKRAGFQLFISCPLLQLLLTHPELESQWCYLYAWDNFERDKAEEQSGWVWGIKLHSIQVPAEASKQRPRWSDKVKKKHCGCRQRAVRRGRDTFPVLFCWRTDSETECVSGGGN